MSFASVRAHSHTWFTTLSTPSRSDTCATVEATTSARRSNSATVACCSPSSTPPTTLPPAFTVSTRGRTAAARLALAVLLDVAVGDQLFDAQRDGRGGEPGQAGEVGAGLGRPGAHQPEDFTLGMYGLGSRATVVLESSCFGSQTQIAPGLEECHPLCVMRRRPVRTPGSTPALRRVHGMLPRARDLDANAPCTRHEAVHSTRRRGGGGADRPGRRLDA